MKDNNELQSAFYIDRVSIRLVKDYEIVDDKPLNNPGAAVARLSDILSEYDREVVAVVNLSTSMVPINFHIVSMGTLDMAIAHPREIFKSSILSNAKYIMLVHNHPSGSLMPSEYDTRLTDRLSRACRIMEIPLLDHIIIGGNTDSYFSFSEKKILQSEDEYYETDFQKLDIGSEFTRRGEEIEILKKRIDMMEKLLDMDSLELINREQEDYDDLSL